MKLDGKRVLIVEDEFFIAADLADEVAAAGAEVVGTASTVEAALRIIRKTHLDGAVLDVNLAGKEGFRIADALADRDIPFVFETAIDRSDVPARHAGVPRVEKPFRSGVVCRALEGVMQPAQQDGC